MYFGIGLPFVYDDQASNEILISGETSVEMVEK